MKNRKGLQGADLAKPVICSVMNDDVPCGQRLHFINFCSLQIPSKASKYLKGFQILNYSGKVGTRVSVYYAMYKLWDSDHARGCAVEDDVSDHSQQGHIL